MEENKTNTDERILWVGLESYDERYSDIFFGRTEEIALLSNAIYNNIQTIIYGPSGTGKTSILRAGIFHKSRGKRYMPVYVRLNHDPKASNTRSYTQQIIDAISEEAKTRRIDIEQTLPYVSADRCGSLWEFFHCNEFWSEDNYPVTPLLVLDQFEEIFTLGKNAKLQDDFFEQLSDLIDNKYPTYIREYLSNRENTHILYPESINFRSVISLREDFLPRLEEHAVTIPALKRNRFSLQCLNEEQALEIIMKPKPGLVSEEVAIKIIEKVTNKKYKTDFTIHDQPDIEVEPSILSLFCRELDRKRHERGADIISIDLVNEFGDNIIKDFYIGTISHLSPEKVEYLENQLLTADGFRDAVALGNAYKFGFTDEEIRYLTNNRLVRIEEWDGAKRMELTHDVLCKVALAHRTEHEEEKRRLEYQRQQEEEKQRILAEEEAKRAEVERKAKEEKERIKRRNRKWLITLGASVVLLILGGVGYYFATSYEVVNYYASYTTEWGWPVGEGKKLSESERERHPIYYKLSHKGLLSKYDTQVEIMSSNPYLPLTGRISDICVSESDVVNDPEAAAYLDKTNRVVSIEFEGDNDKVDKETYYDADGNVLFIVNYFHLDKDRGAVRTFVTPQGLTMPVRGGIDQLDRIKLSWDSIGRVQSMRFFNEKDLCVAGADSIFGYRMLYPDEQTTVRYHLDRYGLPIQADYNAVITHNDGDIRTTTYAKGTSVSDPNPTIVDGPEGYARIVARGDNAEMYIAGTEAPVATRITLRDDRGNVLSVTSEGKVSHLTPAVSKYAYDKLTGYLLLEEYYGDDGKPFAKYPNKVYKKQREYADGCLVAETHTATDGSIPYRHTIVQEPGHTVNRWEDISAAVKDLTRIDSVLSGNKKSITYFSDQTSPINYRSLEGIDTLSYHRKVYMENDTLNDCTYYVYENGAVTPMSVKKDEYGSAKSYFKKVEKYDSDHNLLSRQLLDADGNIVKSMMYIVQDGETIGRAVMGIDGAPTRCPDWEWEGLAYYQLFYAIDRQGNYNGILAINENGTQSILYDNGKYISIEPFNYKGDKIRKKNGNEVKINSDFVQNEFVPASDISRQRLAYLHILKADSPLYKAGLRDGDRILALGSWTYDMSPAQLESRWTEIAEGKRLNMKVLRYSDGKWQTIDKEVSLTPGIKQEEYHIFALTNNELSEFLKIMK